MTSRYIEDLIHLACDPTCIVIDKHDAIIMTSISRQLKQNVALTDRQLLLVKDKLMQYKDKFFEAGIDDFDEAVEQYSMDVRMIDRKKYIRVFHPENSSEKSMIEVRFLFNKKDISIMDQIRKDLGIHAYSAGYIKKDTSHFFNISEKTVELIVTSYHNRNFELDADIQAYYNSIASFRKNPEQYIPGIYGLEIKNLPGEAVKLVEKELGPLTQDTLVKYMDRRLRFGLDHLAVTDDMLSFIEQQNPLTASMISRTTVDFAADPATTSLEQTLTSIIELDRFPLLVVLSPSSTLFNKQADGAMIDQLSTVHDMLSKHIAAEQQSVLFRMNSGDDDAAEFNTYVKENKLNNWVDSNTKVVYINNDKLPKVLLSSGWSPIASLSFSHGMHKSNIARFIDNCCDLNVIRDTHTSIIKQYAKYK